ncbi:hypothetical protein AGMMS49531_00740 [Endomicrobiia bacterium]|nr:hypothetical protein AGMMS49531_00740 [Endomicrobiia bacterium]
MRKTKLLNSSSFILLGFLVLSSCDKKNASLVNRRTATSEKIEEAKKKKEAEERKRKEEERLANINAAQVPDPDKDPIAEPERKYVPGNFELEQEDEKLLHPTGPVNDEPAAETEPEILPVGQPWEEPKHSGAAVQLLHPSPPLLGPDVETIVQYDDSHSDTVKKTIKENKLEPKKAIRKNQWFYYHR